MSEQLPVDERLMDIDECAERLGVSVPTLRRKVDELKIPHIRMGRQLLRFHYPTVFKYLNERKSNS